MQDSIDPSNFTAASGPAALDNTHSSLIAINDYNSNNYNYYLGIITMNIITIMLYYRAILLSLGMPRRCWSDSCARRDAVEQRHYRGECTDVVASCKCQIHVLILIPILIMTLMRIMKTSTT